MDGGAWWAIVHGVIEGQTRLSDFTFTFHFHALEKEMATRSSVLAWRIPGTGEPGGLSSIGSHRVGHDWSDLTAAAAIASDGKKNTFLIKWSLLAHKYIWLFIYLLAALGLHCCVWAFSICSEQGLFFTVMWGFLIVALSLTVEHRLQARRPQKFWHTGSGVVAHSSRAWAQ